jgi:hypothetical protein
VTVYQRVLGERFQSLHPVLQQFLGNEHGGRAFGRFRVVRPTGGIRSIVASALGLPPAGEYGLLLEVLPTAAGQRWVRHFGKHVVETLQSEHRGQLVEASGPASLGFKLEVREGGLFFVPHRAWLFNLPLPLWLAPHVEAENWPGQSGGWQVRVHFRVPLLGQVAEYEGEVAPEDGGCDRSALFSG